MTINVQLKILDPRWNTLWPLPQPASAGAAACDLRLSLEEALTLEPGHTVLVSTGLAIHIQDPAYAALILPRSGMGHQGLVLGNGVGLIDSDYQGLIKLSLLNRSPTQTFTLNPGDRVAQLLFVPVARAVFELVSDFGYSERGSAGFGCTGH